MDTATDDNIIVQDDDHRHLHQDEDRERDEVVPTTTHHEEEEEDVSNNQQLQQDEAAAASSETKSTLPQVQNLTAEQPSDSITLLLLKRELAKALCQFSAKSLEAEQIRRELLVTQRNLEEEKKRNEALVTCSSTTSTMDAAQSNNNTQQQQQQLVVAASLKKLEFSWSSSASSSCLSNISLTSLLAQSESIVRENLLLKERAEFLDSTNTALRNQALVWRKIAAANTIKHNTKTPNAVVESCSLAFGSGDGVSSADQQQQYLVQLASTKLSSLPETAKLKQVCAQVTELLQERAAVSAADGEWRGVVEGLKGGLSSVLTEYESTLKQLAVLRAALARSTSYCVEATSSAQDANAIAADAVLRSQFVSGMLALKGVSPPQQQQQQERAAAGQSQPLVKRFGGASSSSPSSTSTSTSTSSSNATDASSSSTDTVLYYRALLASIVGGASAQATTAVPSSSPSTAASSAPSWSPSANTGTSSVSELNFLRRLVSEYAAKCHQLEQQNKEYKNIATSCANFFSASGTSWAALHQDDNSNTRNNSSNSKNINATATTSRTSETSDISKKVLELWRNAAFDLLKIATDIADKSSTAPFFASSSSSPCASSADSTMRRDLSFPVLLARCSALEHLVSLQSTAIQSLNSTSAQLSTLASAACLWLPSVVEACIPDSSHGHDSDASASSSSSSTSSSTSSSNNTNNFNNCTNGLLAVADDLQSLLAAVRSSLDETQVNFDGTSRDLRAQYELQIQSLDEWYQSRFDGQRLRTNALLQMVRTSDAVISDLTGIEQISASADFIKKFSSNGNQKLSLLGSRNNPKSVSWITSAFGGSQQPVAMMLSSSSSSPPSAIASTTMEQLEKSVKSLSFEFKTRRTQLENKLHIFLNNRDDMQLQKQILQLQEQMESAQATFTKQRGELAQENADLHSQLDAFKTEYGELDVKYEELSQRYDKMKSDAETIVAALTLAQRVQQHHQEQEQEQHTSHEKQHERNERDDFHEEQPDEGEDEDDGDENHEPEREDDAAEVNRDQQQLQDEGEPQQQRQEPQRDQQQLQVDAGARTAPTPGSVGKFVVEEVVEDDDNSGELDEGDEQEQEHEEQFDDEANSDEPIPLQQNDDAAPSRSKSKSQQQEQQNGGANPFASSLF